MGKLYPVEQVDRTGAADLLDELSTLLDHNGIGQVADLIRDGEYDEHEATQAFARHRIEATPAVDREAVAVELAGHFARRPWAEMADDRGELKRLNRENPETPLRDGFDINEPTRDDCRAAADAILALHPVKQSDGLAERVREACAKVCEDQARDFLSTEYATPQPISSFQERFACRGCASAIRSLNITRMDSDEQV